MHTNHRIALLIRASRLYCHSLYQEYDPKYYLIIREVVLNFTNKLFDTKSIENKIDIKVLPLFEDNYIGGKYSYRVSQWFRYGVRALQATTYSGRRLLLQAETYTS